MWEGIDLRPNAATAPVFFAIVLARYAFFAGVPFFVFYRWGRERFYRLKINPVWPRREVVRREIFHSVLTSAIFGVTGALGLWAWVNGHTLVYLDIERYGWGYLLASLPLMMVIHETYFYWTHRWLHHPWWFRRVHRVHHESMNPSPWASFSFHPVEGVIQAAALPLIVCVMPVHPAALVAFLMIMTVLGVINHTGFELYPARLASHPIGKWIISATHHYQHHARTRVNYGLYFTFWDRWLGTEDPSYPALYDEVTARRGRAPASLEAEAAV